MVDFFNMIINQEMIHKLTIYTNQKLENSDEAVTDDEIKAYIGLLLLFGITDKNRFPIDELWSPNALHFSQFASAAMPRKKFQLISKNITFDDMRTREQRSKNKFHKMEEIFNQFKNNIKNLCQPSSSLTVDEELYPFRGKTSFRQYIKSKPARYGIKYWCLVDRETSYLLDVNVYLGKSAVNATIETNVGAKALLKLCEPFFNTNRSITGENFFSSIDFSQKCQKLWSYNLTYFGML